MKTLVQKLCEVMDAMGWIQKSGFNENRRYKYATEADVVAAVRSELAKRHVFVFPNVTNVSRTSHGQSKSGTPQYITDVTVEWTFMDGESGETHTCMMPGSGMDDQDKGLYKAITGSSKYFVMKSFFLPTGDDPEKDSAEDLEESRNNGKHAAQDVAKRKIAELEAKKAEKAHQKAPMANPALFYTVPEKHNGNYAEFTNLKEYTFHHPERGDALRLLFSTVMSKQFARTGTVLVPVDRLDTLLATLAGDMAIDVKKLEAPNGDVPR